MTEDDDIRLIPLSDIPRPTPRVLIIHNGSHSQRFLLSWGLDGGRGPT